MSKIENCYSSQKSQMTGLFQMNIVLCYSDNFWQKIIVGFYGGYQLHIHYISNHIPACQYCVNMMCKNYYVSKIRILYIACKVIWEK